MESSEFNIKSEIASRLTLMCAADESLKTLLLSLKVSVDPMLAKTGAECLPVNYGTHTSFEVDMLGVINGLVGENVYTIVPVFKDNRLVGFKVSDLNQNLSVNSTKQIEE